MFEKFTVYALVSLPQNPFITEHEGDSLRPKLHGFYASYDGAESEANKSKHVRNTAIIEQTMSLFDLCRILNHNLV